MKPNGNRIAQEAVAQEIVRRLSAEEMAILRRHVDRLQNLNAALTEAKTAASEMERLVTHCDPTLALDLKRGCIVRNVVPDPVRANVADLSELR